MNHLLNHETLNQMTPSMAEDWIINQTKSSDRPHGVFRMSLLRAARSPEYSRPFVAGDPTNLIDWRAYARTDQLILRQQRDEAAANVAIVINWSRSLLWPPPELNRAMKSDIALRVALYLCYGHALMMDHVKFFISTPSRLVRLNCSSCRDVDEIYAELCRKDGALTEGGLKIFDSWIASEEELPATDLLYVIQDGIEDAVSYDTASTRRYHLIHTLSSLELDDRWLEASHCYVDTPESEVKILGSTLKADDFSGKVKRWQKQVESTVIGEGGRYFLAHDDISVDAFVHWLKES